MPRHKTRKSRGPRMKGHKRGCRCAIHMRRKRKSKKSRKGKRRGRR